MYGLEWDTRQLDRGHYLNVTFLYATSSDLLGYQEVSRERFCPANVRQECAFRFPINSGTKDRFEPSENTYTLDVAIDRYVSRVISTYAVLSKRGGSYGIRKGSPVAQVTCRIAVGGCARP